MARYLFVYYGGGMAATPAQQKKSMDEWMNWFKSQGQAVIDSGNPTMPGQLVTGRGVNAITGKKVTGYSIFQADDMEEAISIAKSSPQLQNGEIAVYQIMPAM